MMFSSTGRRLSEENPDAQAHHVLDQWHQLLRTTDWSNNPIGPPESWPREIMSLVNVAFASYTIDCVFIGPEMRMI